MKLLYCIPALYNAGGMERVISEKANYLIQLPGYEITIVTTDQKGKAVCFPLDERIRLIHLDVDFDGHFAKNLPQKYLLHRRKLKSYKHKLTRLLKESAVDICISFCGKEIDFLANLDVKCSKIAEIHFAMNVRKQFMTSRHKGFVWGLLGDIRTRQLKKATKGLDKLIVLTREDQIQWEKSHSNIVRIPNPNPLKNNKPAALLNKCVISVGKLDAQKGFDMLVEAWAIVANKHPDWVLNIFGVGEWESILHNRIEELNMEGKIHLRGKTLDVVSQYLDSSIYVMSSRYEGLPMVLIEAISCGLPIVSFDCEHGPAEIINNGTDGFLVFPNDIHGLADKICVLIENDELRKEMGFRAFEKSKSFSIDCLMQQWISLFRELHNNIYNQK